MDHPGVPTETNQPTPGQTSPSQPPAAAQPTGFWQRNNLLGDIGGLRTALGGYGISFGLQETAEVFANATGGVKRGASGNGLTMFSVGLDTEQAFRWEGGTFNASVLQIWGPLFSQGYLLNLQTVSGIAAEPTVRLWELWYQQAFKGGKLDVKIGQQSLDQEFMISQGSGLFLNAIMGWPILPTADLYNGGPAYPLSSLGLRLRALPAETITLLAGVFDDNPPGGSFNNDSQLRGAERYGVLFNLNTGALMILEAQYAINLPPAGDASAAQGLPGRYKIGAWFDTAKFPDQRFDNIGLSLADPTGSNIARYHWHNYSFYAVADQTIWHPDANDPLAVSLFLRPMVAPSSQNLIDFSVNAGVTVNAPLRDRSHDSFGIGFGVANVSGRAVALDRDTGYFSGTYFPVRGAETFIELTYQAQITPWLVIQPDFQYIWMPGGGIMNPAQPSQRVGNEAVFGIRTNVTF